MLSKTIPMFTVLHVESDAALRATLREALSEQCYVQEAADLAATREQLALLPAHVILARDRLPDGSGIDACVLARESAPECLALLYGEMPPAEFAVEAINRGHVAHYLIGEIQVEALVTAVTEALAGYMQQTAQTRQIDELRTANELLAHKLEGRTRDLLTVNEQFRSVLDRMQSLVITDELTGLGNRQAMQDKLQQAFREARRYDAPVTCVLCTPTGVESITTGFGQETGDALVQEIARRLRLNLRDVDFAARTSGDEFVVLLPHTSSDQAMTVIDRLQRVLVETPFPVSAGTISLAFCFGVSQSTKSTQNSQELFTRAVEAARQAGNVKTPPAVFIYPVEEDEKG
ncbi:MAG: GGDEF domain-containing response regulator [Armatimonadota bacterium]